MSEGSLETMIMTDCQALIEMAANTLCLKNDTTLRCYNSDSHKPILIIILHKCSWESRESTKHGLISHLT